MIPLPASTSGACHTVQALDGWRRVDFISDLHLHDSEPVTAQAWHSYLRRAPFDALFILGDLFEVWPGDDVLDADDREPEHRFIRHCRDALRDCTSQRPVYVMRGNRDFLLGPGFFQQTGCIELDDPTLLVYGESRVLLSHGDAWCLEDHDYMRFRAEVRSPDWQAAFLTRPLAEREAMARQLRRQSEARKQNPRQVYADVDTATAKDWLQAHHASILIHGHTHRPGWHDLGPGLQRAVLSDWSLESVPPRAETLSLNAQGRWQRLPVT